MGRSCAASATGSGILMDVNLQIASANPDLYKVLIHKFRFAIVAADPFRTNCVNAADRQTKGKRKHVTVEHADIHRSVCKTVAMLCPEILHSTTKMCHPSWKEAKHLTAPHNRNLMWIQIKMQWSFKPGAHQRCSITIVNSLASLFITALLKGFVFMACLSTHRAVYMIDMTVISVSNDVDLIRKKKLASLKTKLFDAHKNTPSTRKNCGLVEKEKEIMMIKTIWNARNDNVSNRRFKPCVKIFEACMSKSG